MTNLRHLPKKQIETTTTNTPQEEQIADRESGLGSFHAMQQAIKNPSKTTLTPNAVMQLQRTIGNAAVQRLIVGSASNPTTLVQRTIIGLGARHHMHIDIAQPHYKHGNDRRNRIEIGHYNNYDQIALQDVIDTVKGRLTEPGAQECYDWCLAEARELKQAKKANG